MPHAIIALALIWLVLNPLHFYAKAHASKPVQLATKVIATLMATAFAGYAALGPSGGEGYAMLIFIGLLTCSLADVMLEIRFEIGGGLFFLGHVVYIAALVSLGGIGWYNAAVFAAAFLMLTFFLWRYRPHAPSTFIKVGVLVYAVALSALLGFGVPLPFVHFHARAVLIALGATLFVLSDMTLCHNTLTNAPVKLHFISLGIYYTAQLLLGLSAFPIP